MLPAAVRYCDQHAVTYEQQRGSRQARGYGMTHDRLRRSWARRLADGELVFCWRCGHRVFADSAWDLGHDDHDRSRHRGPECENCNRRAGGRAGARARR
jgi:hypothetical protein